MELLEGEDLGKRLAKSGGRLPPSDVNFVVQNVCRALSRAHQAGVVHRDLKPDNIFVVKDDDRDIVKILDFGVAKSTGQALDGSNTKTGAMLGTPYYMSPEQAQGIKSVDARSDLWSLAVIVFQALTGRLPFESEALGDLLVKIIVSPVPTPSHYYPMVPPGFDAWWVKAADRNVDNRFQNAKLFAESLSLALGQSSVTDVTDRSRLHRGSDRPGGATAIMVNAAGTEVISNVPNTPHPGAHTAAIPMNTPQGAIGMNTPQNAAINTPQGMQSPPMHPPPAQAPHANYGAAPGGITGNPVAATFSGMDSVGVPKKSPPIALFVGVGLLAVVGLGLGGFAMFKKNSAQGSASGDPATSASMASAGTTAPPPSADPAATPTAKATETMPDPAGSASAGSFAAGAPGSASASAVAAATPPGGGSPHTTTGGAAHPPIGGGHPAAPPVVAAKTPTTPPATPPATPATPATTGKGKEKPINLGF
jgi:serine/threonine-protein kinase